MFNAFNTQGAMPELIKLIDEQIKACEGNSGALAALKKVKAKAEDLLGQAEDISRDIS